MKIKRVTAYAISIPLPEPVADAVRLISQRDHLIVEIEAGGVTGTGFSLGYDGSKAMVELVDALYRGVLLNADPFDSGRLWDEMYRLSIQAGRRGAALRTISAIDIALWDLRGKLFGRPVMELLGVHSRKLRCYATGGYYRKGFTLDELVREVQGYVEAGFTAVKMKVGKMSAAEDAARMKAVRKAVGDEVDLLLDANGGWPNAPVAIAAMRRLEEYRPYWIEEPVRADNLTAMREIAAAIQTPVATGELESTRWAFAQLIEQRAAAILQPDATVVGGVSEWMQVAHMAAAFDVPIAPHYNWDIHTQLCAAIPNWLFVEYFMASSGVKMLDKLIRNPMTVIEGWVEPRTGPGFGIDWNQEEINRHRI